LIPLMILNAMQGQRLPVYGEGLNVRDWIHVQDHCRAVWVVLERGRPGEIYNIGGGSEWRNIDIVKLILGKLGKPESLIEFVADRPGHDLRYAIDVDKIRAEIGWEPEVPFEQGIEATIEWYRDNTEWVNGVLTEEYRTYYQENYGARSAE